MRKLNLQLGSIKEMLTKEQMKRWLGDTKWDLLNVMFYSGRVQYIVTNV